jgi:hypothetical protein
VRVELAVSTQAGVSFEEDSICRVGQIHLQSGFARRVTIAYFLQGNGFRDWDP